MKFTHEYDHYGNHRLVLTQGHQVLATGEWASYQGPAFIFHLKETWMCWTSYYSGTFQEDRVYTYNPSNITTEVTESPKPSSVSDPP